MLGNIYDSVSLHIQHISLGCGTEVIKHHRDREINKTLYKLIASGGYGLI